MAHRPMTSVSSLVSGLARPSLIPLGAPSRAAKYNWGALRRTSRQASMTHQALADADRRIVKTLLDALAHTLA